MGKTFVDSLTHPKEGIVDKVSNRELITVRFAPERLF
jgi:hypothetical protein